MKEKIRRFMMGRYGTDELTRYLIYLGIFFLLLDLFVKNDWLILFPLILLGICYFRMLSKNHRKRYEENQIFLKFKNKIFHMFKQNKNYHFYTCPGCKQKIRIPRGKGKIEVACPKCGQKFIKKS